MTARHITFVITLAQRLTPRLASARQTASAVVAAALTGANVVPATAADGGSYGAVYTITNAASGNGVVYYRSASDGTLPSIRVSRAREYQMASSLAR
jgi:hypothetical protein